MSKWVASNGLTRIGNFEKCVGAYSRVRPKQMKAEMKNKRIIITIWAFFLSVTTLRAQEMRMQAPSAVGVGDQFGVSYTVSGRAERIEAPKTTNLTRIGGPSTSTSHSVTFVNGHRESSSTYTYTFYYRADAEGTATLGEASCVVDGKRLTSRGATIQVQKSSPRQQQRQQDPWDDWADPFAQMRQMQQQMMGGGSRQSHQQQKPVTIDGTTLFAQAAVSNRQPYAGEQIIVTYRVYTQVSLRQFLIDKLPGNKGFWAEDLTGDQRQVKQWEEEVNGKRYMVAEIRRGALYAQQNGKLRIEPLDMDVLAMVPRQRTGSIFDLFDDPFFNMGQAVERHLRTSPIDINVKPLPTAPDSYCGAVGQFNITSSTDNTELRANEAITYRITIKGKGNLMLINAPDINFPASFEVYDPVINDQLNRSNDGVSGSRTFEWVLIPRSEGEYEIPATTLSYFDPKTGQYVSQQLEAVKLKVGAADARTSQQVSSKRGIDRLNHDINYIHTRQIAQRPAEAWQRIEWWFWALLALIIVAILAIPLLHRHRQEQLQDVAGMRQKRALRQAKRRLKKAEKHLNDGNDEAFYEETYKAIWGCLADKYNIELAKLSSDTVRDCLSEKQVAEQQQEEILQTLQEVDFARFGPGDSSSKKQTIYSKALTMIRNLSFVIAALFVAIGGAQAQNTWQEGNVAYQQGDYAAAIDSYEQLLQEGVCAADLYYNLGNAYYRTNHIGLAVLNYERSLLLSPSNRDARENLAIAQDKTVDHIQPLPRVQIKRQLMKVVHWTSARGWRVALLILLLLTGAALTLRRIAASYTWRKRGFVCTLVLVLLLLPTVAFAIVSQRQLTHSARMVVLKPEVAVYSAPENNSNLVFVVHEGLTVDIEESLGDWYRIRLDDGNNGWIHQNDGERI